MTDRRSTERTISKQSSDGRLNKNTDISKKSTKFTPEQLNYDSTLHYRESTNSIVSGIEGASIVARSVLSHLGKSTESEKIGQQEGAKDQTDTKQQFTSERPSRFPSDALLAPEEQKELKQQQYELNKKVYLNGYKDILSSYFKKNDLDLEITKLYLERIVLKNEILELKKQNDSKKNSTSTGWREWMKPKKWKQGAKEWKQGAKEWKQAVKKRQLQAKGVLLKWDQAQLERQYGELENRITALNQQLSKEWKNIKPLPAIPKEESSSIDGEWSEKEVTKRIDLEYSWNQPFANYDSEEAPKQKEVGASTEKIFLPTLDQFKSLAEKRKELTLNEGKQELSSDKGSRKEGRQEALQDTLSEFLNWRKNIASLRNREQQINFIMKDTEIEYNDLKDRQNDLASEILELREYKAKKDNLEEIHLIAESDERHKENMESADLEFIQSSMKSAKVELGEVNYGINKKEKYMKSLKELKLSIKKEHKESEESPFAQLLHEVGKEDTKNKEKKVSVLGGNKDEISQLYQQMLRRSDGSNKLSGNLDTLENISQSEMPHSPYDVHRVSSYDNFASTSNDYRPYTIYHKTQDTQENQYFPYFYPSDSSTGNLNNVNNKYEETEPSSYSVIKKQDNENERQEKDLPSIPPEDKSAMNNITSNYDSIPENPEEIKRRIETLKREIGHEQEDLQAIEEKKRKDSARKLATLRKKSRENRELEDFEEYASISDNDSINSTIGSKTGAFKHVSYDNSSKDDEIVASKSLPLLFPIGEASTKPRLADMLATNASSLEKDGISSFGIDGVIDANRKTKENISEKEKLLLERGVSLESIYAEVAKRYPGLQKREGQGHEGVLAMDRFLQKIHQDLKGLLEDASSPNE